MCGSPAETGLYYLQSRYYDPESCRFINADGYASTGQGLLGSNMFVYCENNPINKMDNEGTFGCAIIGALVGGLLGGFSSVANGGSFWAGAAQGAVSGGIAGFAVDFVLWTGGTGALALLIVGVGGAAGSFAGDVVYSGITNTKIDLKQSAREAAVAAVLNIVSFGFSKALFNRGDYKTFAEYMFKPTITDIPSTIITGNIGVIGAMIDGIGNALSTSSCRTANTSAKTNRAHTHLHGGMGNRGVVTMIA